MVDVKAGEMRPDLHRIVAVEEELFLGLGDEIGVFVDHFPVGERKHAVGSAAGRLERLRRREKGTIGEEESSMGK